MSFFEICLAGVLLGTLVLLAARKPEPCRPVVTVQQGERATYDYSGILMGIERAIRESAPVAKSPAQERALELSFRVNRAMAALAVVEPEPPVC